MVSAWFDEAPTGKICRVSGGCSWRDRWSRGGTDLLGACEDLDDEHRGWGMPAHKGGSCEAVISAAVGGRPGRRLMQQLTRGGDVGLAASVGEQAVVTDAMKARGQDMQQEAADELLARQRHGLVARSPVFAVVLPAEGDAAIIMCDEP